MEEASFKVGRYSAEERRERIDRYRAKRSRRNFNKTIKYVCRKTLADGRQRVRGRFVRNDAAGDILKASLFQRCEDEDCFWSLADFVYGFRTILNDFNGFQIHLANARWNTTIGVSEKKLNPAAAGWSAIIGKTSGRWGRVTTGVPDFNSSPAAGTQRSLGFPNPSKSRVQRSDFILCNFHVKSS
ncbi:CCT motif family protein [Perilla frutescens var. frutescens]|nr:CCT motif family protein [Perilla frutescens var. frutescens]